MKEALEMVIAFIKGLMQPLITVFALMVGSSLVTSGKVSAEQAWLIPVGVIAYWFADKSGIWDKLFKGEGPKAESPIVTGGDKASGWGDCGDYDHDNETVSTGFSPAEETGDKKVDEILDGIFAEAKADGRKADVAYVSSHIVSYLGAHGDELDDYVKEQLILAGVNYATIAFKEITGSKVAPTTYAEVAQPQKFWANFKHKCTVKNYGLARGPLMTLRDLLSRREAL